MNSELIVDDTSGKQTPVISRGVLEYLIDTNIPYLS